MAQAERLSTAICTSMARANAAPSTSPAIEAHALYLAAIATHPPCRIRGDADSADIKDVADDLKGSFAAFAAYLTARLDDLAHNTGRNVWRIDCDRIDGLYREFTEEVERGLTNTADAMAAYETWRAS